MTEAEAEAWTFGRRERMCGSKVRFASRPKAKKAIKRASQQHREARSLWHNYRCDYCGWIHIGHKMKKGFQLKTVADAIAHARRRHRRVVIPPSVDDPVADLEAHEPGAQRRWAERTLNALRTMDAYACAKRDGDRPFVGNFYMFCQSEAGASVPVASIKLSESRHLMQHDRLVAQRYFPVDAALDPSGRLLMESHLRLQKRGNPAPRLYFYDDSMGPTGRVHVGYVGKHLDNTHTSRSM